jgi:hypothetical protein
MTPEEIEIMDATRLRPFKLEDPEAGDIYEGVLNGHNLSTFERKIIEHLPEEFKYMARDADGELFVYVAPPEKSNFNNTLSTQWESKSEMNKFRTDKFEYMPLKDVFKNVKWENDEPWNFREEVE